MREKDILYLSFDGLTDPLGSSQILPLLMNLSIFNKVNILSLEKKFFYNLNYKNIDKKLKKRKINHFFVFFKKNKILKLLSFMFYFFKLFMIFYSKKIKLIHLRGYQAALFLFPILYFKKIDLIFDIRGFWPEEKVERFNWSKNQLKYKIFKKLEKFLISYSLYVICLTNHSKNIIIKNSNLDVNKIIVIPTCSSKEQFYLDNNYQKQNQKKMIFGYFGTTHGAYDFNFTCNLIDKLIMNKINIFFKIYTYDNHDQLIKKIKKYKYLRENFSISYIEYHKVQEFISSVDLVIFFLKENYSVKASFPTKISEILLCGKPIICNSFNDDIKKIIMENDFIFEYDKETNNIKYLEKFIFKVVENKNEYSKKISIFALDNLEIDVSNQKYNSVYKSILNE